MDRINGLYKSSTYGSYEQRFAEGPLTGTPQPMPCTKEVSQAQPGEAGDGQRGVCIAQCRPDNIGAEIITNTILEVPYYKYSIMGPNTLFQFFRPLY